MSTIVHRLGSKCRSKVIDLISGLSRDALGVLPSRWHFVGVGRGDLAFHNSISMRDTMFRAITRWLLHRIVRGLSGGRRALRRNTTPTLGRNLGELQPRAQRLPVSFSAHFSLASNDVHINVGNIALALTQTPNGGGSAALLVGSALFRN